MTTYARVAEGIVREIFILPPMMSDRPMSELFHPNAGQWVDITNVSPPPEYGWTYDESRFAPPPAVDAPARAEWAAKLTSGG